MSRLTLLGTVHRDPKGLARLVRVLEWLKPDMLTLEFSAYGLRFRQSCRKLLRKKLLEGLREIRETDSLRGRDFKKLLKSVGIGGIVAFLDLPFEYKGARLYTQRHHLPLFFLDTSSYSRQLLLYVDELLSPANLKKVVVFETITLQEAIKQEYVLAKELLLNARKLPWQQVTPREEQWEERDKIMAERIRKALTLFPRSKIVHIGGWRHLLARQGTLFNLLKDVMPRRVLLGHLYL